MKLGWKGIVIVIALILVVGVAVHFLFPESVVTKTTADGKQVMVTKRNFLKIKA